MPTLSKFTYPFRYVPSPEVQAEAKALISHIESTPELDGIFRQGKMLGVLICSDAQDGKVVLRAFSGLAGGRSTVEGFVPPIFDTTTISELQDRPTSPQASNELQNKLFDSYIVHNAIGESLSVKDIFARRGIVPPGGTGECAAPKLLNFAYLHHLKPIAMGEFWYGYSPRSGEVREHGRFYPSCTGKCGPLLSWMMEGLDVEDNPLQRIPKYKDIDILHEDEAILVVYKPCGMLCAPGLTGTKSLIEVLEATHGPLLSVHRLDMDTSGIIVYAKTPEAQSSLQEQFASRKVKKTYLAHLCAGSRPWKGHRKGTIALPLSADYYDRPRQIVDFEHGKQAITDFEILEIFPDGEMDVRFYPKTGRTHQLRVHSASPLGLGRPIKGDALYGSPSSGRLMLHAETLTFNHPTKDLPVTYTAGYLR